MIWQSYENRSIIVLDEPMAEQLSHYLEKKESQLSRQILEVMLALEQLPALPEAGAPAIRLSEAVEEFGRKVQRLSQVASGEARQPDQWKFAARQISQALWSYVEVLEGCVIELFQQIDQVGFEQWDVDVVRTATSIKDELTHRMDDVIWAMRRLEQQLQKYRTLCEAEGGWFRIRHMSRLFSSLLDRSLESTVRKCNKFLHFRYHQFIDRYTGYLQLYDAAEKEMRQCDRYPVLASMDIGQQQKVKQLYFLLKLWEKNCRALVLPKTEPIRALRSNLTFDSAIHLFQEYAVSIRQAIFDQSRMIKQEFRLMFVDKESRQPLIDNLVNYRLELRALKTSMETYRKFHLETDPGAKGWWKRMFSPRRENKMPKQFRTLHALTEEIKTLEHLAAGFQSSLEKEAAAEKNLTPKLQNEVHRSLHEMGQPLTSKDLMRRNAKALLSSLQNLDEIAAFDPAVVEFIGRTLCKAMCSDWKYHVLQEIPSFHHVYEIHQGFFSLSGDRLHLNRLHKFQKILNRLDTWIKNHETLKHTQEVDLDVHDIKAYLQDFLAYVQRLEPEGESLWENERFKRPIGEAVQALLEYLHLFGRFCSHLHRDNSEHRLVRKQLLFIDQYFEAIERRIQELYA